MKFKKKEPLLGVLLGIGLNLLDSLRERLPDNFDDVKGRVRDTYDTASRRVSRASYALRGEEDSHILGNVGALLIGVGVGVGVGLLVAPARGEKLVPTSPRRFRSSARKSVSAPQKSRRTQLALMANMNRLYDSMCLSVMAIFHQLRVFALGRMSVTLGRLGNVSASDLDGT